MLGDAATQHVFVSPGNSCQIALNEGLSGERLFGARL